VDGILEREAFERRTVPDAVVHEVVTALWRRWLA
jgi:hypothetical protein